MFDVAFQPPAPPEAPRRSVKIEVFGFDVAEASQIRRIRAFIELGHEVHSFTMRRRNMNPGFVPDWPNTHLYDTENEALGRRARVVAGSILRMAGHRARLRAADVIVARNLDMLAIAAAARRMAQAPARLVYEALDIHGALTGPGRKARALRWAERALLREVDLLVVSSPGFLRNYFEPVQGYRGAHALWENKLALGGVLPTRPRPTTRVARPGPLRLGWVGTIRCAPSLALLAAVAAHRGERVEVHIHGIVHRHVVPEFDRVVADHPNIYFHGPFSYPGDLLRVYGGLDLVWAQDLWQVGGNSDWLLPNRIYEASWAGCPSLAVDGSETARRIASDGLGWTIPSAEPEALDRLLDGLSAEAIAARGRALLAEPETAFVQPPTELSAVIEPLAALSRDSRQRRQAA